MTTPNYPNFYYKDLTCTYIIQADVSKRIVLSFFDFDLPKNKSVDGNCLLDGDYLDVELGLKETRRYCTEKPTLLHSSNNFVKLVFNAGKFSSRGRGFRLTYITENAGCGGVLNAFNGTVDRFPCLACEWIIQVKERNYIRLTFNKVEGLIHHRDSRFINIFTNDTYRGDRLVKS